MTPETPPEIRSLIGQTFSRSFIVERGQVNTDERTVALTFSSETSVERWFGLEILDHSPGAADLTRLNSGAPVLVCHDRHDQCGGIVRGSVAIQNDRMGHAVCLFSQSARGQEIQTDVNDGIRGNTSFRYIVREMVLESSKDGVDSYRVTKWEGLEVSFENIPADITTGAERTIEFEVLRALAPEAKRAALQQVAEREGFKLILDSASRTNSSEPPAVNAPTAPAPTPETLTERTSMPETIPATPAPAVNPDLVRMQDIAALGDLVGMRAYADELALEGKTYDEARTAISAKRTADQRANMPAVETAEQIAARNKSEPAQVVSRVRLKHFKDHTEAYRFAQFLGGVRGVESAREWCRANGFSLARAHSSNDNESGGIFVPQEFSETLVLLREQYGLVRQFGDTETMTSQTKMCHRQKGGLTAYPVGAKGVSRKGTASQMTFDAFELNARKWKVTTKIEDELSDDSKVSIADKFAGESSYAFAKAEDNAFFNADGTSTYHGIVGLRTRLRKVHATIASIKGLIVASGNLFSEFTLADFIKVVAILPQYGDNENTAWYMHRTFFWNTVVPLMIAAGGTTVKQIEDAPALKFLSYPVRISQSLPRADANSQIPVLLGDIKLSSTFGDRMGQQVKQADQNDDDWDNDLLSMKCTERFDINHHDVGDTIEAGPVVGLISAAS